MSDYFCVECEWCGGDPAGDRLDVCPRCWGPALSVEALEERAGIIEYSEIVMGNNWKARAEYLAVASAIRGYLGPSAAVKPEFVKRVLRRWYEITNSQKAAA